MTHKTVILGGLHLIEGSPGHIAAVEREKQIDAGFKQVLAENAQLREAHEVLVKAVRELRPQLDEARAERDTAVKLIAERRRAERRPS